MKNRFDIIAIGIGTAFLAGCSYLQSYFPDKERDYQYTTEIPMIDWPAELRKNQPTGSTSETSPPAANLEGSETGTDTENAAPPHFDNTSAENTSEEVSAVAPEATNTPVIIADESDERDTVSSVEIIKYDDGESRLRIGAGFSKSWRVVSKALSRNTIEVTERNHDQGQIAVRYDPDEKKAQDGSYMDEISFIFKGLDINDREYVLKLEKHDQQTDAIVLDEEHLPLLNDDAALRLLKVLADTIKADLADKDK
ncbi:outer membrane protein assembly factor BamC [Methyloglobulus sp.]|uniref:outer membrane protein assembly factor BamC n=1 Tax=Methyloglobulus sp. TaxID=2518622 RepID=UPI00398966DC